MAEAPYKPDFGLITTDALGDLLGRPVDGDEEPQAIAALMTVSAYAAAHTRGRGFISASEAREDIAAVVVAAAARLYVNPDQLEQYTTGDYSARPAVFKGWTLAERAVLDRYRRKAA